MPVYEYTTTFASLSGPLKQQRITPAQPRDRQGKLEGGWELVDTCAAAAHFSGIIFWTWRRIETETLDAEKETHGQKDQTQET